MYLTENDAPNEIKTFITSTFKGKFDLKLLVYQSGEILLQYLQIGNANGTNEKIEYLFDTNKKPITKYEYLAKNNQNYTSITNQNAIDGPTIGKLKKYILLYGVKTDLFGLEKNLTFAFAGQNGHKFILNFPSRNSKPSIVSIQPIETKNMPLAIIDYLKTFVEAEIVFGKIVYLPTEELIEVPPKIDKYVIEIKHGTINNKANKILMFDEKFNLLK